MMKRILYWVAACAAIAACGIYGARADTSTVLTEHKSTTMKMIQFAWTSNGVGTASGPTLNVYSGRVVAAIQMPGSGGTQPSNLYDVVVTTAQGDDVLAGTGANVPHDANLYDSEKDGLGAVGGSILTLSVTAAGANKTGTTIVYIR